MCAATLYSSNRGSYKTPILNSKRVGQSNNANLGKVELKWVVRAQANVEPCLDEIWKRIPFKREEKRIIAQRAHSDPDLLEVKQILQRGNFTK